jgi:hypothetical protein
MKVFQSRIGWELWGAVAVIFIYILIATGAVWLVTIGLLGIACFFLMMTLRTSYIITADTLIVRCWPFVKIPIPIGSIHRIHDTWNPIASPAASYLGRIEVHYGVGRSCIISPKDKSGFVSELLSKNNSILTFEVKRT